MPNNLAEVHDLDYWLRYISTIHPREIELGLDRIRSVAENIGLQKPAPQVVVVAGTNGKGSCITTMETILLEAGYRVASYTSPHIQHFAERIKVNGIEANESLLCSAFARVEAGREGISLSYFEFSTLAALWIFCNAELDVVLLEVGLGGRLDAVNIVDGDVTVISSIALDHQDWLGDSLDLIGAEKAGILRSNVPLVYGDRIPVVKIIQRARQMHAPVYLLGDQFDWAEGELDGSWNWRGYKHGYTDRQSALPNIQLAKNNAALALQALFLLDLELPEASIKTALQGLHCAGRQEHRIDVQTSTSVILDVAHNPAAMLALADHLQHERKQNPKLSQISVVMAVMADKDIEGMVAALESWVDIWYIAQVEEPRCMPLEEAAGRLEQSGGTKRLFRQDSVATAYGQACKTSVEFEAANPGKESMVVVVGSFFTVAAVRELSKTAG
ncbi:MAG: bifunctional tetrahydrofolate synthase/dihydrofolate synthase [Pseudomonadales bacterium]|nr:bifunctional tetrahydrofolate synthase/dihydrofolate synthase [Pseudomonadales bacterium]